ncbi:hypothetical protein EV426DRAFT_97009 [Tirmania nivea]|nr:hypothetical protein EV426DRAFT_97009 [Tirmania nivea]
MSLFVFHIVIYLLPLSSIYFYLRVYIMSYMQLTLHCFIYMVIYPCSFILTLPH